MKVRYVKAEDAPEGLLRLSVGNDSYKLDDKDNDAIEVEDPQLVASLDDMPHLRRDADRDKSIRQAKNEDARDLAREEKAQLAAKAAADKHNAEKAPEEPAKSAQDVLAEKRESD